MRTEHETQIDWGVKSIEAGDKNVQSMTRGHGLMTLYSPDVLVLANMTLSSSRRSARIKNLNEQIASLARSRKLLVKEILPDQMKRTSLADGRGTKHEIAQVIASRFPDQLGSRLPPKRHMWDSEDSRMGIFDAVALACAFPQTKTE